MWWRSSPSAENQTVYLTLFHRSAPGFCCERWEHATRKQQRVFGANIGFYDTREDGDKLLGDIDNQAAFSQLSARHCPHSFMVGYQAIFGDNAFPRVFNNVTPLGNEVFNYTWQLL